MGPGWLFGLLKNVEHYEYLPEFDGLRDPWPRVPYPDVQQYAFRDYGNRVGYLADILEPTSWVKYGIKCWQSTAEPSGRWSTISRNH